MPCIVVLSNRVFHLFWSAYPAYAYVGSSMQKLKQQTAEGSCSCNLIRASQLTLGAALISLVRALPQCWQVYTTRSVHPDFLASLVLLIVHQDPPRLQAPDMRFSSTHHPFSLFSHAHMSLKINVVGLSLRDFYPFLITAAYFCSMTGLCTRTACTSPSIVV